MSRVADHYIGIMGMAGLDPGDEENYDLVSEALSVVEQAINGENSCAVLCPDRDGYDPCTGCIVGDLSAEALVSLMERAAAHLLRDGA